jgi:pimeloyl-ACP methyl ester carboxylesterase
MPTYLLLPGLNGDLRIFDRLAGDLSPATAIAWIAPLRRESIAAYAERLSMSVPRTEDEIVVGVSFGGIIAREFASHRCAKACVIISSIRDSTQLSATQHAMRLFAPLITESALATFGAVASSASPFIGVNSVRPAMKLAGENGEWRRWAIASVLRWQASSKLDQLPLFQIHGDCDSTFPIANVSPDFLIEGGGHLIALSHAEEIAREIERFVKSL